MIGGGEEPVNTNTFRPMTNVNKRRLAIVPSPRHFITPSTPHFFTPSTPISPLPQPLSHQFLIPFLTNKTRHGTHNTTNSILHIILSSSSFKRHNLSLSKIENSQSWEQFPSFFLPNRVNAIWLNSAFSISDIPISPLHTPSIPVSPRNKKGAKARSASPKKRKKRYTFSRNKRRPRLRNAMVHGMDYLSPIDAPGWPTLPTIWPSLL